MIAHLFHDREGSGIDFLAEGCQLFAFLFSAQQFAERPVSLGQGVIVSGQEDGGNAGLLLQSIHIFCTCGHDPANVDDDLWICQSQLLHIQIGGIVKLTEVGKLQVFFRHDALCAAAPFVGQAHQHIRCDGIQNDLRQRSGGHDPADVRRNFYLSAAVIGEDNGRRGGFRSYGGFAAAHERKHKGKYQYKSDPFLHNHSPLLS